MQSSTATACPTATAPRRPDSIRLPWGLAAALSCIIDWARGWSRRGEHPFVSRLLLLTISAIPHTHTHMHRASSPLEPYRMCGLCEQCVWFCWSSKKSVHGRHPRCLFCLLFATRKNLLLTYCYFSATIPPPLAAEAQMLFKPMHSSLYACIRFHHMELARVRLPVYPWLFI